MDEVSYILILVITTWSLKGDAQAASGGVAMATFITKEACEAALVEAQALSNLSAAYNPTWDKITGICVPNDLRE